MKFSKLLFLAILALCLIVSEAHSIRRPRPYPRHHHHHHEEEEEEGSGSEVRPHFPHHHHHHHHEEEEESGSVEHPHPRFPPHFRFRHEEEKEGSDSEEHPHPHPHFPPHFRPHHHHHHKEESDSDSEEHPHFPPHFRPHHHHHHEEESDSDSEEHPHFPPHFRPHHHHHHKEESDSDSEEHPHFRPHHHHHHHKEEEESESEEHPQLRHFKGLSLKERKEKLLKLRNMKKAGLSEEKASVEQQLKKAMGKRRPTEKLLRRAKKVSGRSDVEEVQYTTYSDAACEDANEIIIKSVGCKMRVFGSFEKIVFDEQNENNMTVYSYTTPGCNTEPVNGRSFLKNTCTLDPSTNEYVKWEW